ncbi:N-acetylmuramoyl-L-alanine amidase [Bacteroides sp. Phil13]|uniref:N-acetylmuramoyl-L-alanine amidase family protein n=1 Tax=Bacteroides sp. Phil13 TaxID=1929999 RepID=UPI000B2F0365|nr:N-acetylmuramoyl-L-alanine amidase [Bacteroides sp. Phil13]
MQNTNKSKGMHGSRMKVILPIIMCFVILCYLVGCESKNLTQEVPLKQVHTPSPEHDTKLVETVEPDHVRSIENETTRSAEPRISPSSKATMQKLIVIDAGHQAKGNSEQEPIGPGAKKTKKKVSGGTRGTTTGMYEYKLNLIVALKLQGRLQDAGYRVIMTRTSNEVNISNAQRAKMANDAGADAMIRIHANGSENQSVCGVETISNTIDNPYNGDIYPECHLLSECLLTGIVDATGAQDKGIWETDTMTGINWSKVPTTIVEMGYMTNKEEETLLTSDDYQNKIVEGIVAGLNQYFKIN